MKRTIPLVLALVLGSYGPAVAKDAGPEIPGLNELIEHKGLFDTTLIRPDTDFGRYGSVKSLNVTARIRGQSQRGAPPSTGSILAEPSGSRAVFSKEDVEQIEGILREAFVRGLGGGGVFDVVEDSTPGTLLLRAAALDMVSKRASRSARQSGHGERRLTGGTLVVDVFDAETGVLLARFAERRKIERVDDSEAPAGNAGPWPEVEPWFERAASDVLGELEKAGGATAATAGGW